MKDILKRAREMFLTTLRIDIQNQIQFLTSKSAGVWSICDISNELGENKEGKVLFVISEVGDQLKSGELWDIIDQVFDSLNQSNIIFTLEKKGNEAFITIDINETIFMNELRLKTGCGQ